MHVVVVGCGRVGSGLAGILEDGGHTVAVVDKQAKAFRRLPEGFGGRTIQGVGFDRDLLREAGIEEAGALAAVTSGDNSNIMVARTAREVFGLDRVIARIYDPRRAAIYEKLGIPTIATVQWTTDRVLRRILPDAPATEWTDPSAGVVLVERPVAADWAGRRLADLDVAGLARVAALSRLGVGPGARPRSGHAGRRRRLHDGGRRSARGARRPPVARSRRRRPRMKVVIVGGGNVGTFIAAELTEGGHDVTIIELEADRVARAQATGEPAGVRWVLADACEVDNLRKVPLDGVDVLAAVTGDDEDNLVVSLLAKQEFAVPRVIARVNNPKNHWMFNENWGVDVAVSTPHLLTSLVEEAVSVGTLVRLLSFERGRASLIEVTLAADAKAANRDIVELDFPRDSTIVAVLREERVIFPRGDTLLLPGDEVLVLVTPDSEADVQAILTER